MLVVDSDFGLSSLDVFLGLQPVATLQHVLLQEKPIDQAIVEAGDGLKVITGGSGILELANLGADSLQAFIAKVKGLSEQFDDILVDGGAGVGTHVQAWMQAADECIFVGTPDPASLMALYATAKTQFGVNPAVAAWLIVNQVENEAQGQQVSLKMTEILGRFLNRPAKILKSIPYDKGMGKSARMRIPCLKAYPFSGASRAIRAIAVRFSLGIDAEVPETIVDKVKGMVGFKKAA